MGQPLTPWVLAMEGGGCLLLLGIAQLAHRSSSLVLPGWLIILNLMAMIFIAAQDAGGLDAPVLVALPLVPMLSSLLLGRNSLPWLLGLTMLMLSGLLGLQLAGEIEAQPFDAQTHSILHLVAVMVMMLLCAGLGYYCDRQNDRMQHQLTLLAHTDGLTGVANRRFFDDRLNQEWLRNRRISRPLSLLLVDIDHFKQYNDTYGHVEGDRCLVAIAQVIAHHCRRSGELVARYGGEEFAVILPNVDLSEAAAIADGLRAKVERLHSKGHPDLRETVTVSIGFASAVPYEFEQQERFVVQADEALYRAKRAGRNQSVGSITPESRVNAEHGF